MLRSFAVILLVLASTFSANAQQNEKAHQTEALLKRLQAADSSSDAAEALIKLGKSEPEVKAYLATHLPSIIDRGPQQPSQPWTNAVRLAGELQLAETVSALAKWIGLNAGGTITLSQESKLETSPPAKALAQIGGPAIPALSAALSGGNLQERWNATYVLNLIGGDRAKEILRGHLKQETDTSLRDFISKIT